jgi:outer membrane receptor protein involved in Fe transport
VIVQLVVTWVGPLFSEAGARSAEPAQAPNTTNAQQTLADMKLEELIEIEVQVTSVTKTAAPLSESPAAIYVIKPEDIRRNGFLTVPESLRLVPGLEVARTDSGGYAISSRGMNERLNRQLLVLIDGRSVYSQLTSGVAWEALDVMIEDLDRIEVIRGPGASLFGANAVSGVINIVTKKAKDTQGLLVTGGSGSETPGYAGIRYGGHIATNLYYRVYGTYLNQNTTRTYTGLATGSGAGAGSGQNPKPGADPNPSGQGTQSAPGQNPTPPPGTDIGPRPAPTLRNNPADWLENGLGGARLDWEASATDQLTWQGDYFTQLYRYPLSGV